MIGPVSCVSGASPNCVMPVSVRISAIKFEDNETDSLNGEKNNNQKEKNVWTMPFAKD